MRLTAEIRRMRNTFDTFGVLKKTEPITPIVTLVRAFMTVPRTGRGFHDSPTTQAIFGVDSKLMFGKVME